MTFSAKSLDHKRSPSRAKSAGRKSTKRVTGPKQSSSAQINRRMEAITEREMESARQNAFRLTSKVHLSQRDFRRVLELLRHPPVPNARLRAAARALPR